MPLIIGVLIFSTVILGFNYGFITLNLPGSNNQEQTLPEQIKPFEPLSIVPTSTPTPNPTPIPPPNVVIKQPTNDAARERKEKEIDRIDEHIGLILQTQSEHIKLKNGFVETFKKCDSEWCRDSLRKDIEWIDKLIKDNKEQIEALELQRATILSGL